LRLQLKLAALSAAFSVATLLTAASALPRRSRPADSICRIPFYLEVADAHEDMTVYTPGVDISTPADWITVKGAELRRTSSRARGDQSRLLQYAAVNPAPT
jgi:hypothetical protein